MAASSPPPLHAISRDELLLRQRVLLWRSARLRGELGGQGQQLARRLAWAEQASAGARWLLRHPHWPVGALAVLALWRPRRALRWAGRLWWGWQLLRRLTAGRH